MNTFKTFASHVGIAILSLISSIIPITLLRSSDVSLIKFLLINIGTIAPIVGIIYYVSHKFIFGGLIQKWYWHPLTFSASSYVSLISLFFYLVANNMLLDNIDIQKTSRIYLFTSGFAGVFVVLLTFKFISLLNGISSNKAGKQEVQ